MAHNKARNMKKLEQQRQFVLSAPTVKTEKLQATSGVQTSTLHITPQMAARWLETNTANRDLSQDRVESYARDMARGAWRLNNQGIAIAENGVVLDGQHRLWAVVLSGATIESLLMTGLATGVRSTIDRLRPRSISDDIAISGGKKGQHIVAWMRSIDQLVHRETRVLSSEDMAIMLTLHDAGIQWAVKACTTKRSAINSAPIIGAMVFAYSTEPTAVERFWLRYSSGAALAENAPEYHLRKFVLESNRKKIISRRDLSVKTLSALRIVVAGESIHLRLLGNEKSFWFFARKFGILESTD